MLKYDGFMGGDRIRAVIYDSPMGGVNMEIYVHRYGEMHPDLVHYVAYDNTEDAKKALQDMFKNVKWR